MNITNLEITQATIELSLAFAFIVTAISLIFNKLKKAGMKEIIALFFLMSAILSFESLAYICRGNTEAVFIVFNRISNFFVFFLNFTILSVFIRYVFIIFNQNKLFPSKKFLHIVDLTGLVAILILVINIFTGWMYKFDTNNYYQRNIMWYFYTALSFVLPVVCTILCLKNRTKLSKVYFYSIMMYVWLPIVFLLLQTLIYGYSIITIGLAIDLFIMFAFYLMELRNTKITDDEIEGFKIKKIQSFIIFLFLTVFISAALLSCIISINRMVKENNKRDQIIVSNMICDKVEYEFQRLITVSETMSQDYSLKQALMNSDRNNPNGVEEDMINYLSSIQNGFKFQMVYAASDISKVYYTYKGVSRIIDENNYGEDIWYKNFYDSNKTIEINFDTDKDTDYVLSVFVNSKVFDDEGNIIGICGVGITMDIIQEIFLQYENKYDATISIIDDDGLIKIASDDAKINISKLDNSYFSRVGSDSFYIIEDGSFRKLTKHINIVDDYYVVINYFDADNNSAYSIITPSLIIFIIGLFSLGSFFIMTYVEDRRAHNTIIDKKKAAITDEMTGLLNRSAYEQDIIKFSEADLSDYAVIQFDINCLKNVNDTYGHKFGDELIVAAAHCISNVLHKYGKCYRTGGDEFIAIVKCSKKIIEEQLSTIKHLCSNFKDIFIDDCFVSIGVVFCNDYPNLALSEMIVLSDNFMYDNKNSYYIASGKKRR